MTAGAAGDLYTATLAWITDADRLDRNASADRAGDGDHFRFHNLAWHTSRLGHHLGFANLAAGGVRNSSCANFLSHRASGVRNLLGDGLTGPGASRVRNSLGDRLASPGAGRVGNLLRDRFACPRAGRIGDPLGDRVLFVANASIRNLLDNSFGDLSANGVRLLTVTDFLFHACAGDSPGFHAGDPSFAADGAAGLLAYGLTAAGGMNTTGLASIPTPGARITDVSFHDRTGDLLRFGHPVASANLNFFCFTNRFANRVADIAVARLRFGAVSRAANVTIFRFADWFGDIAADVAVAGLVDRFANGAADIAVTGLIAGFANGAANFLITGLEAGLADRAADVAIACLVDGSADRVAFIARARFVNVPGAGHGELFCALIVDCAAARDGPLIVDRFTNRLVSGSAAALRCAVVSTRSTCRWRTAFIARRPAVRGFDIDVRGERQQARNDDPGSVSHQSVP